MTGRSEVELALDRFLADGPETVADRAVEQTLAVIDRTKQRRDLFARWRFNVMISFPRLAAAAVVAVVAVGGGAYLLGQRSGAGGPVSTSTVAPTAPIANPTASPTTAPTPTVDPTNWVPFTSAIYGFSAAHPTDWTVTPASGQHASAPGADSNGDTFWSMTGWPDFNGYEFKIPAGTTADAFIQAATADAVKTACYPTPNMWTKTTVDGHPASIAYWGCNEHFYSAQATVVIGTRIWFFNLDGPDRSLIVPFLTTVKIDPTKVVD